MTFFVLAFVALAWFDRDGIGKAVAGVLASLARQPRRDP